MIHTQTRSLIRPRIEYYAWRHLPFWQFQGLDILITLFDSLVRIPDVTEMYVARQKLAFFHSDIIRADIGTPQHPETQALAALLKTAPLNLKPFDDIFTAMETEIDRVQSIDDNDLNRYCKRKRGSFLLICGEFLKKEPLTEAQTTQLERLGIFIERTCLLQLKATHPNKAHLFSLNDFSLVDYVAQTRTFLDKQSSDSALNPLILLACLYDSLLTLLEKSLPIHPNAYITLNPMNVLFLSFFYRIKGF